MRILVHQPNNGTAAIATTEAHMRSFEGFDESVEILPTRCQSSLLNLSFNEGVAQARNSDADFFALLHSDVDPGDEWLWELVNALEESQADIIHAPVAIKDSRGETSTAIATSEDMWKPRQKLTVAEVLALPDIFDIADVQRIKPNAKILLPNTGCMVMRCNKWFREEWGGFANVDRISMVHENWQAQVVPEDWMLGFDAYHAGQVVVGTTRVRTRHHGHGVYSTHYAWGEKQNAPTVDANTVSI